MQFLSSWTSCFPCAFKYKYIAKQESSGPDAAFLFEKMSVNRLTYLPGMYRDMFYGTFIMNFKDLYDKRKAKFVFQVHQ